MGPPRKRTFSEPGQYDITDGFDGEEKHAGYDTRDSSFDEDRVTGSPGSSRDGYGAREAMLQNRNGAPPNRRANKLFYQYRIPNRTMRWLCFALMSTIIIFIFSLFRASILSSSMVLKKQPPPPPVWESFGFLERYYGGIRTLVSKDANRPEYPIGEAGAITEPESPALNTEVPASQILNPYPDYKSAAYVSKYGPVRECFLDDDDTIRVPLVQSYTGVTNGFPEPAYGSYDVLGISNSTCYDRFGKLGPYGYGYSSKKGGIGAGLDGEREGADNVWKQTGQVDYRKVQWGKAQNRCLDKNQHRFLGEEGQDMIDSFRTMHVGRDEGNMSTTLHDLSSSGPLKDVNMESQSSSQRIPRSAVIIRTWHDYRYTNEAIIYLRSLVAELALLSGGEYTIHFLIHVKDNDLPIWSDEDTYEEVLRNALPEEFRGMGTLWSERQMALIYGGLEETMFRDLPVYGVYRSAHFPLQWFAKKHPEYEYFWNWEMDARYTGHWYKLFESLRGFAREQPRKGLWERNGRYYIPSVHGSWEDFRQMVRVHSEMPAAPPTAPSSKWKNAGPPKEGDVPDLPVDETPVWGPRAPDDVYPFPTDQFPSTSYEKDSYSWGVGEEADLIVLNPLFDPTHTGWLLTNDVTGYNLTAGYPPRRTAIITASRLSRRLLETMHTETALKRHTMFSEMWPASNCLHHGLKAVYAPHPVYIDRRWPTQYLAKVFNNGLNGAAGGARTSVFNADLEHNFRGVTWYYNDGFSQNFWKRWLGFLVDGHGGEEEELSREGRMCVPAVLLHPVKEVELVIEEPGPDA